MVEVLVRFFLGGIVVSMFAMFSDALRPKSFAGLFGAAPSIALATLGMTIHKDGSRFAAIEARSMLAGSVAFLVYAAAVAFVLRRSRFSALGAAFSLLPLWFLVSFSLLQLERFL